MITETAARTKRIIGIDPGRTHDPAAIVGITWSPADGIMIRHASQHVGMSYDTLAHRHVRPLCQSVLPHYVAVETNNEGHACLAAIRRAGVTGARGVATTGAMDPWRRSRSPYAMDKPYMVSWMRERLRGGRLRLPPKGHSRYADLLCTQIQDISSYQQLSGSTAYRARLGRHDDLWMAAMLACHVAARLEGEMA